VLVAIGIGESTGITEIGGSGGPFTPQASKMTEKKMETEMRRMERRDRTMVVTVSRTKGF
jgi:hypothetical protein